MECPTPVVQNSMQGVNMATMNIQVRVCRKFFSLPFTSVPLIESGIKLQVQVRILLNDRVKTHHRCY